jgi:hypothetical protein
MRLSSHARSRDRREDDNENTKNSSEHFEKIKPGIDAHSQLRVLERLEVNTACRRAAFEGFGLPSHARPVGGFGSCAGSTAGDSEQVLLFPTD